MLAKCNSAFQSNNFKTFQLTVIQLNKVYLMTSIKHVKNIRATFNKYLIDKQCTSVKIILKQISFNILIKFTERS